jgi:hypothetical protein
MGMSDEPAHDSHFFDRDIGPEAAERVSAGVYGSLVACTTLIGVSDRPLGTLIWIVIATNLVYYATHVFAYTIGSRPRSAEEAGEKRSLLGTVLHHAAVGAPLASAAFLPIIVVVVLELFGVEQSKAVLFGVIVAALSLASVATTGIYLRGVRGLPIVLSAIAALVVAGLLVWAKLSLH